MLAVEAIQPVSIGDIQQQPGIRTELPRLVNLQLHPKEAGAFPVKNRLRFIVVILDVVAFDFMDIAVFAQGILLVLIGVSGVLFPDDSAAALTGGVIAVIAPLAERGTAAPGIVFVPDPFPAHMADNGFLFQTGRTKRFAAHLVLLAPGEFPVATGTDKCGVLHDITS